MPGVSDGAGAVVIIHRHKAMPFPEDNAVLAPPGSSTAIAIRQVLVSHNCAFDLRNGHVGQSLRANRVYSVRPIEYIWFSIVVNQSIVTYDTPNISCLQISISRLGGAFSGCIEEDSPDLTHNVFAEHLPVNYSLQVSVFETRSNIYNI